MNLLIQGHSFRYEMERLTMMFFPMEKIHWFVDSAPEGETYVLTRVEQQEDYIKITAGLVDGVHQTDSIVLNPKEEQKCELAMGRLLYKVLCRICLP